ncbi:hypothetical protein, partial [Rhizobium leguminosarum]|uniref:hypothetical protein n=1 Tax=Rhizobium leguminosarum TaxID=384 RepID=UPI003F9D6EE4
GELRLQRGPGRDPNIIHNLYVDDFDRLTALRDLPHPPHRFAAVSLTSSEVAMTMGKSRGIGSLLLKHFQWYSAAPL